MFQKYILLSMSKKFNLFIHSSMKQTLLAFFLCLIFTTNYAQIKPNEKLVYVASYNMNGLMTTMAQLSIETELLKTSKSTYLHTSLTAETYKKWESYFKMRDLYESYVNPKTLKPSMYKRNVNETGYTKTEKYIFSKDGKSIKSTSQRKTSPETKRTVSISENTTDIVSLMLKLRTLDYQNFKLGQKKTLKLVFDEKEFSVSITFKGKETIKNNLLGAKSCYKISIGADSDALSGKDQNLMWLSEDEKIPVLVKFNIPVGAGQLELKSISTTK